MVPQARTNALLHKNVTLSGSAGPNLTRNYELRAYTRRSEAGGVYLVGPALSRCLS